MNTISSFISLPDLQSLNGLLWTPWGCHEREHRELQFELTILLLWLDIKESQHDLKITAHGYTPSLAVNPNMITLSSHIYSVEVMTVLARIIYNLGVCEPAMHLHLNAQGVFFALKKLDMKRYRGPHVNPSVFGRLNKNKKKTWGCYEMAFLSGDSVTSEIPPNFTNAWRYPIR